MRPGGRRRIGRYWKRRRRFFIYDGSPRFFVTKLFPNTHIRGIPMTNQDGAACKFKAAGARQLCVKRFSSSRRARVSYRKLLWDAIDDILS